VRPSARSARISTKKADADLCSSIRWQFINLQTISRIQRSATAALCGLSCS
jgi:hypothetical protein